MGQRVKTFRLETFVSIGLLAVLVCVVVLVLIKQSHFEYSVTVGDVIQIPQAEKATVSPFAQFSGDIFVPMSAAKIFDANNLADKINGKAELYLPAGFISLNCQRYKLKDDAEKWLELFLFDMGTTKNAFAVFSNQRRSGSHPLPFAAHAYRTANSLHLVHGQWYIEVIAAVADDEFMEKAIEAATLLVESVPVDVVEVKELALLPEQYRVPDTEILYLTDAFVYEKFDNMFSAAYTVNDVKVTAFISERTSPENAKALVAEYSAYLKMLGGSEVNVAVPDCTGMQLFDVYELVFAKGTYIVGIHEADNKEAAEIIANLLYQNIMSYEEQNGQ